MAGEIVTKKITELEENTTIDDADILMAGDKGTNALKRFTIGAFLTAIKAKLAAWTFDTLQTTSKTLPGAVNELNSKTIYINSVPTPELFKKGFLYVTPDNKYGPSNKTIFFRQEPGVEIADCPEILKSKEFIGQREVFWYGSINIMVRITEFYPIEGRIWTKFYNNGTWSKEWKSITPQ